MIDGVLAAARFALYAALAATAGLPLFWWNMGMAVAGGRRMLLAGLVLGSMALTLIWLLASLSALTGTPLFHPDRDVAAILLAQTPLGPVIAIRLAALLVLLLLLALPWRRAAGGMALAAAIAAATFAWTGHAAASEGVAGSLHRIADALHAIAAAGWLGALLILLHGVMRRMRDAGEVQEIARLLARFSTFGTLFAATLIVTGIVNVAMIAGLPSIPALTHSFYGLLLGAKLGLFALMLLLAAANRWRLTGALAEARTDDALASARRHLRLSLAVETAAALGIVALVAMLGTLDPLG